MTTTWPSELRCTSSSIMSAAQSSRAERKAASVFSGARPEPPRCATSSGAPASTGGSGRVMALLVVRGGQLETIRLVHVHAVQAVEDEVDQPLRGLALH